MAWICSITNWAVAYTGGEGVSIVNTTCARTPNSQGRSLEMFTG